MLGLAIKSGQVQGGCVCVCVCVWGGGGGGGEQLISMSP